jgi:hypothetical protein
MVVVPSPNEVSKHAKLHHKHGKLKLPLKYCYINYRTPKGVVQSKIGFNCDYCGFLPNEETQQRRLKVLEMLEPQYGSESTTSDKPKPTKAAKPKGKRA